MLKRLGQVLERKNDENLDKHGFQSGVFHHLGEGHLEKIFKLSKQKQFLSQLPQG